MTPPPVEPPDVPMPDVPMPDVPTPDVPEPGPAPDAPIPDVPEPAPTPDVPTPDVPTPAAVQPLVPDADGLLLIPDMTGWSRSEAEEALRAVGLVPVVTLVPAERAQDTGNVTRHRPGAGEKRGSATMIFLYVGEGTPVAPPDVPFPDVPSPDVPLPDVPEPTVPTPDVPEPAVPPMPPDLPEPMPDEPGPRPDVPEPLPGEPFPDEPLPDEPLPDVPEPAAPPPVPPPVQPGQARPVPDVVGEKRVKAEGLIRAAGLQYQIVLKVTEYPPDGTVLGQDPAPGESLPPGGEVVIEVAKAPAGARIPVPQVTGLERAVAERMLRDAGFLVNVTYGGGAADEQGLIADQAPQAESLAPRRSWVEIVVVSGTGARRTARGGPPSLGPPGAAFRSRSGQLRGAFRCARRRAGRGQRTPAHAAGPDAASARPAAAAWVAEDRERAVLRGAERARRDRCGAPGGPHPDRGGRPQLTADGRYGGQGEPAGRAGRVAR